MTAVVRSAAKSPSLTHTRLKVVIGDPCEPKFLTNVFRGQDAVISTLGGRSPTKRATSVYPSSADAIVEAAWATGLKKVVVNEFVETEGLVQGKIDANVAEDIEVDIVIKVSNFFIIRHLV